MANIEMENMYKLDENRNVPESKETDRMLPPERVEKKPTRQEEVDEDPGEDCPDGMISITVTTKEGLKSKPEFPLDLIRETPSVQNIVNENKEKPQEKKHNMTCDCSKMEIFILCFCTFLIISAILVGVVLVTVFKNSSSEDSGDPLVNTTTQPVGKCHNVLHKFPVTLRFTSLSR